MIVAEGCTPASPPPNFREAFCRAGDVLRITLAFSNPGPARIVELIAVAHSPDGKTEYSFLRQDLEVTLPPGQSTRVLDPVTIPAGLNTGAFHLEAALLHKDTQETLSRHFVVRTLLE
jgi:hypothetical protein